FVNQRLAVVPLEGSAAFAFPPTSDEGPRLTVYAAVQMPHMSLAAAAQHLGMTPASIRLIAPDMGGGFGGKNWLAEHAVTARVAQLLERPARWVETRSEHFVSMGHGRSQTQYVELGLRRTGEITGMHTRIVGDGG